MQGLRWTERWRDIFETVRDICPHNFFFLFLSVTRWIIHLNHALSQRHCLCCVLIHADHGSCTVNLKTLCIWKNILKKGKIKRKKYTLGQVKKNFTCHVNYRRVDSSCSTICTIVDFLFSYKIISVTWLYISVLFLPESSYKPRFLGQCSLWGTLSGYPE